MVFAHTIVEAPKKGAIRRAAAISAPSVEDPTTNTSSSSGGRARASGAAGTVGGAVSSRVATLRVWRGASARGAARRPRHTHAAALAALDPAHPLACAGRLTGRLT